MKKNNKGQTLVALMVFVLAGMAITTAATFIIAANSLATSKIHQAIVARQAADSGAENALMRLIRDRNYTGETFNVGESEVIVTVSGEGVKKIVSKGKNSDFVKKVEVMAELANNVLRVISWKEIY